MNSFEKNILKIYPHTGKTWLSDLPKKIDYIANLWKLDDLFPYANFSFNYILQGYQKGTPIILKISCDILSLTKEMETLMAFKNFGAVNVLDYKDEFLLIQKVIPGKSLKTSFPKENSKNIQIACEVVKRLHQAPIPKNHHFPHIKDWLITLDEEWAIPRFHLEKARCLKNTLLKTQKKLVLLHGDLHQNNILLHHNDWLVIDPKGVIGYPINELWACVENLNYDLKYISEYFNYSYDEVVKWYYVHLILTCCWQVKNNFDYSLFLNLAEQVISFI